MKNQKRRGLLATIGAVAAAATLALSGTVAANAADPTIPLPAAGTTGNLTITKLEPPEDGATDWDNTTATGTAVPDVVFQVRQVEGIDLSVNQGWRQATRVALDTNGNPILSGTPEAGDPTTLSWGSTKLGLTNSGGVAQTCTIPSGTDPADCVASSSGSAFQDMPIGLYYVEEVYAPDGVVSIAPFFVTIPITDPVNLDAWQYNVNLYPKNSVTQVHKQINDSPTVASPLYPYSETGTAYAQTIDFTITADVPRIQDPDSGGGAPAWLAPEEFTIVDALDENFTVEDDSDIVVTLSAPPNTTLTQGAGGDYTVDWGTGADENTFTITFTSDGLAKLATAAATFGSTVVVKFPVEVAQDAEGSLENVATVCVAGEVADCTEVDSPAVATKWAPLAFTKKALVDGVEENRPDAKFSLYTSYANAKLGGDTGRIRPVVTSAAITGLVTFTGLRYSDWANDGSVVDVSGDPVNATQFPGVWNGADCEPNPNYIVYWLTETEAPEGFELLANPVPVQIVQNSATSKVEQLKLEADGSISLTRTGSTENCEWESAPTDFSTIINVEKNAGFTLPLTGGTGTILLTIGGLAVLAIVLVVATRRRRMADVEE